MPVQFDGPLPCILYLNDSRSLGIVITREIQNLYLNSSMWWAWCCCAVL
jgi:hypothetical protein